MATTFSRDDFCYYLSLLKTIKGPMEPIKEILTQLVGYKGEQHIKNILKRIVTARIETERETDNDWWSDFDPNNPAGVIVELTDIIHLIKTIVHGRQTNEESKQKMLNGAHGAMASLEEELADGKIDEGKYLDMCNVLKISCQAYTKLVDLPRGGRYKSGLVFTDDEMLLSLEVVK
jgi:hypothetical protein